MGNWLKLLFNITLKANIVKILTEFQVDFIMGHWASDLLHWVINIKFYGDVRKCFEQFKGTEINSRLVPIKLIFFNVLAYVWSPLSSFEHLYNCFFNLLIFKFFRGTFNIGQLISPFRAIFNPIIMAWLLVLGFFFKYSCPLSLCLVVFCDSWLSQPLFNRFKYNFCNVYSVTLSLVLTIE